jgi:hypothetical protein
MHGRPCCVRVRLFLEELSGGLAFVSVCVCACVCFYVCQSDLFQPISQIIILSPQPCPHPWVRLLGNIFHWPSTGPPRHVCVLTGEGAVTRRSLGRMQSAKSSRASPPRVGWNPQSRGAWRSTAGSDPVAWRLLPCVVVRPSDYQMLEKENGKIGGRINGGVL